MRIRIERVRRNADRAQRALVEGGRAIERIGRALARTRRDVDRVQRALGGGGVPLDRLRRKLGRRRGAPATNLGEAIERLGTLIERAGSSATSLGRAIERLRRS